MSKNRRKQTANPTNKSPIEVLVAKYGILGSVLGAFITLMGTFVTAYFGYKIVQTQIQFPIHATQTAEANFVTKVSSNPTDVIGTPTTINLSPPQTSVVLPLTETSSPSESPPITTVTPVNILADLGKIAQNLLCVSYTDNDSGIFLVNIDATDATEKINLTGELNVGNAKLSSDGTKILFEGGDEGSDSDIYLVKLDGSEPVNLTNTPGRDTGPKWSPDNKKILFDSERDGNWEIYSMNADGSEQTNLTNNSETDYLVDWSPDGTSIAFTSTRDGSSSLYTMKVDGSEQTNITNLKYIYEATWSPNGRWFAFVMQDSIFSGSDNSLYVVKSDGSDLTLVSDKVSNEQFAFMWSPDSKRIAWLGNQDGKDDIYIFNVDSFITTRLTNNSSIEYSFSWGPNSEVAAVSFAANSNVDIYLINIDGGGLVRLTTNTDDDIEPVWSPDGNWIAFQSGLRLVSNHFGSSYIYIISLDGMQLIQLTTTPRNFYYDLQWQP